MFPPENVVAKYYKHRSTTDTYTFCLYTRTTPSSNAHALVKNPKDKERQRNGHTLCTYSECVRIYCVALPSHALFQDRGEPWRLGCVHMLTHHLMNDLPPLMHVVTIPESEDRERYV